MTSRHETGSASELTDEPGAPLVGQRFAYAAPDLKAEDRIEVIVKAVCRTLPCGSMRLLICDRAIGKLQSSDLLECCAIDSGEAIVAAPHRLQPCNADSASS